MSERYRSHVEDRQSVESRVYVGFTKDQQQRVDSHIQSIGFPTENVKAVVYRSGEKNNENVLGSFQPAVGTLTLYKSLDKLPPIAQHATIVHELAHSVSPFDPNSEKFYGSKNAVEEAKKHAIEVAKASIESRRYLNGYQAKLHGQLEAGEIEPMRFIEETRAIMFELRFNNPEHLKQVEHSQREVLAKINKANPEARVNQNVNIMQGVDKTISTLIPALKSKKDIDKHVSSLKNNLLAQNRPILPNRNYQLAA